LQGAIRLFTAALFVSDALRAVWLFLSLIAMPIVALLELGVIVTLLIVGALILNQRMPSSTSMWLYTTVRVIHLAIYVGVLVWLIYATVSPVHHYESSSSDYRTFMVFPSWDSLVLNAAVIHSGVTAFEAVFAIANTCCMYAAALYQWGDATRELEEGREEPMSEPGKNKIATAIVALLSLLPVGVLIGLFIAASGTDGLFVLAILLPIVARVEFMLPIAMWNKSAMLVAGLSGISAATVAWLTLFTAPALAMMIEGSDLGLSITTFVLSLVVVGQIFVTRMIAIVASVPQAQYLLR